MGSLKDYKNLVAVGTPEDTDRRPPLKISFRQEKYTTYMFSSVEIKPLILF